MTYQCSQCGVSGVKLWRQYETFLSKIHLLCVDCAFDDQKGNVSGQPGDVLENGLWKSKHGIMTDNIGWLVPAVPSGDTFWGYSSVPDDNLEWWKELPLRKEHEQTKV